MDKLNIFAKFSLNVGETKRYRQLIQKCFRRNKRCVFIRFKSFFDLTCLISFYFLPFWRSERCKELRHYKRTFKHFHTNSMGPDKEIVCFVWFDSLCPINNLSVIKGRVFLGWTSTKLGLMLLLKDTTQWRRWGSNLQSRVKHCTTEPLRSPR